MSLSAEEVAALPAVLTIKEAREVLGISLDLAYAAAHSGELPVIRLGRRMLVPKAALVKMLGLTGESDE